MSYLLQCAFIKKTPFTTAECVNRLDRSVTQLRNRGLSVGIVLQDFEYHLELSQLPTVIEQSAHFRKEAPVFDIYLLAQDGITLGFPDTSSGIDRDTGKYKEEIKIFIHNERIVAFSSRVCIPEEAQRNYYENL